MSAVENVLKTFLSVAIVVFVILGASFRRDLQTNTGFKQPFLITYLATCLLSLYMIIFYLYHYITITYKTSFSPSRFFLSFFTSLATGSAAPSVSSVETTSVESPTSNSASTSPSPNSDSGVVLSLPLLLHPSPSSPQSHLSSSSSSAFSSVAPPPSPSFLLHEEFLDKAQLVSGQPLSHLLLLAFPFTLLWLITNYFFTLSLSLTSVASAVSLEQAATIFVFLLSILFLKEPINAQKVIAVSLCISGIVVLSMGDEYNSSKSSSSAASPTHPVLGDILVLISTFSAACYMVGFKHFFVSSEAKRAKDRAIAQTQHPIITYPGSRNHLPTPPRHQSERSDQHWPVANITTNSPSSPASPAPPVSSLLPPQSPHLPPAPSSFLVTVIWLGCIGTVNLFLGLPILLTLHLTGLERFEIAGSDDYWDSFFTTKIQALLCAAVISSFCFNTLANWGICVFSPLFIRLVIACTIPASFALDLLFHHDQLKETNVPLRVAGALLITFGFVLFTMSQSLSQRVASASPSADLSSSYQHQHRKDNSQYHSHQQLPPMSTY